MTRQAANQWNHQARAGNASVSRVAYAYSFYYACQAMLEVRSSGE